MSAPQRGEGLRGTLTVVGLIVAAIVVIAGLVLIAGFIAVLVSMGNYGSNK